MWELTYENTDGTQYPYGCKEVYISGGAESEHFTLKYETEKERDYNTDFLWGKGTADEIKKVGHAER